jgi:small multidrug resistance pump
LSLRHHRAPSVRGQEPTRSSPTLGGLARYGFSAFAYMIALRKIPVSVAYPSVALSYALVAILGHFLFGETFGVKQMGGIALIIGGVGLLVQS